jgi:hypothetical protein
MRNTTKWGIFTQLTVGIRKSIENSRDEVGSVSFRQHEKGHKCASSDSSGKVPTVKVLDRNNLDFSLRYTCCQINQH